MCLHVCVQKSQPMQVDSVSIPVDRHNTAEGISNIDVITQIHNIPSRQIVRMDSEQALNCFMNSNRLETTQNSNNS